MGVLYIVTLVTAMAIAVTAHAQDLPPNVTQEIVSSAMTSPWATVTVAAVLVAGQIASAMNQWSAARKLENESIVKRNNELERQLMEERTLRIKAEYDAELASAMRQADKDHAPSCNTCKVRAAGDSST